MKAACERLLYSYDFPHLPMPEIINGKAFIENFYKKAARAKNPKKAPFGRKEEEQL